MPSNNNPPLPTPRMPLLPSEPRGKARGWLLLTVVVIIIIIGLIGYHFLTSSKSKSVQPSVIPLTSSPNSSPVPTESLLPSPSPSPTPATVTIEIRNGTHVGGLAQRIKDKLTKEKFNVSAIGNAANRSVVKTTVYNLTVADADVAQQLAKELSANTAATLPKGEAKSSADILIILGAEAAAVKS